MAPPRVVVDNPRPLSPFVKKTRLDYFLIKHNLKKGHATKVQSFFHGVSYLLIDDFNEEGL